MTPEMRSYAQNGFLPSFDSFRKGANSARSTNLEWAVLAARAVKRFDTNRGRDHSGEILSGSGQGVAVSRNAIAASHGADFITEMRRIQSELRAGRQSLRADIHSARSHVEAVAKTVFH